MGRYGLTCYSVGRYSRCKCHNFVTYVIESLSLVSFGTNLCCDNEKVSHQEVHTNNGENEAKL